MKKKLGTWGGDAKFESFNDLSITEIMIRWPSFSTGVKEWVLGPFSAVSVPSITTQASLN